MFCLECGHSWKDDAISSKIIRGRSLAQTIKDVAKTKIKCCQCHRTVQECNRYTAKATDLEYSAILTTFSGYQIVRVLHTAKYMKKSQPAAFSTNEVMQHWISPEGKIHSLAKATQALSGYVDSWIMHTELEFRSGNSYALEWKANLIPLKIHPKTKIIPEIRRNGFKHSFYGMPPIKVFASILSNPQAETLIKAKQIPMFKHAAWGREIDKYWPSIRICIRNGYEIKDVTIWMDYIDLLNQFGKDILNAKYVCPKDLDNAHDQLVKKKDEARRRQSLAEQRKLIDEDNIVYTQAKALFFDLRFISGCIEIIPLKSVDDFFIEGDKLKHCLFTNQYHRRDKSLVMSARINREPVETIEVSLENFEVIQSRGMHNKPSDHHAVIVEAVRSNMGEIIKRATHHTHY